MKTHNSIKLKSLLLIGVFLLLVIWDSTAQTKSFLTETKKLLSLLDLEKPELSAVKQAEDNSQLAAAELLKYYKARISVKHPITQQTENEEITEKDLEYANDALKHVFVGQPAYPSHFCGEDIDWNSRPVPDLEWVWQLNRMYFWNAMGKVYSNTGKEKYGL